MAGGAEVRFDDGNPRGPVWQRGFEEAFAGCGHPGAGLVKAAKDTHEGKSPRSVFAAEANKGGSYLPCTQLT